MTYNSFKILFTILFLAIGALVGLGAVPWWWLIALFAMGIFILSYGSATIQSNFFVSAVSRLKGRDELALTFDDGPHPCTDAILDLLKEYSVTATFFCIGLKAERHPETLKRMVAEGHTLGNHTQTHSNRWGIMRSTGVQDEINQCSETLEKITGEPVKYFRPPFGVTNPRIGRVLKQMKLTTIGWDLRSLDTSIKDTRQLWKRVEPRLSGSSIILFHDTQAHTVEVLEMTLKYCQTHGIKIVSLAEKIETH